jgi:hypothetical protein
VRSMLGIRFAILSLAVFEVIAMAQKSHEAIKFKSAKREIAQLKQVCR